MTADAHAPHPIRLVVEDDYRRNRLTVFLRLLLAIPHYIWFFLWSLLAILVVILNWFATLILGRPPAWIHRFLCSFIRYSVHLGAYLGLVGNPYPGFAGKAGEYPIDVELPAEPQRQARLKTLFRFLLAIPALLIGGLLGGTTGNSFGVFFRSTRQGSGVPPSGLLYLVCAILGWFASLVTGRMPKGLRDAGAYSLGYSAQVRAYLFLITDRYPNSDPTEMLQSVPRPSVHPVHVVGDAGGLRRSRITVFFRLLLAIPHFVWLYLWGYAAAVVVIINWFATLFMGRSPRWCHRFLSRYVRYQFHVYAFVTLAANPFPGFTGAPGSYPLDLELPADPQRQSRWKTFFRFVLAVPALLLCYALAVVLFVGGFLTWWVALVTGRAPWGLRNLMAYALRYFGQLYAYLYLLTDRYPHASPLEGEDEPSAEAPAVAAPAESSTFWDPPAE